MKNILLNEYKKTFEQIVTRKITQHSIEIKERKLKNSEATAFIRVTSFSFRIHT